MSLPAAPASPVDPYYASDEPRRWFMLGLTAMFVLIGVAVLVSVLIPVAGGNWPMMMNHPESWGWIPGIIGFVIGLLILIFLLRLVFWAVARPGYPPYGPYYGHRHHRHDWWMGVDPAVEVARERYARGEISREQLDQTIRDLTRTAGPP